jgi:hypothetical protein
VVVLVACIAWDLEPEAAAVLGSPASGASGLGVLAWFWWVGAMVGRSEAEEFTGRGQRESFSTKSRQQVS